MTLEYVKQSVGLVILLGSVWGWVEFAGALRGSF